MADKFEDLRTYLAVVSCGGINAAAAELGIAKSAVSRRISELEARLGAILIDRGTRRFEVTAVGRAYAREARTILASLDALDSSLGSETADRTLSFRGPRSLLVHKLIPAVKRLDLGDHVKIRFIDGDANEAPRGDEIVVGATAGGAGSRPMLTYLPIICGAPSYLERVGEPKQPSDLDGHRIISVAENPAGDWRFGARGRWVPRADVEVPDDDTAAAAALAGLGLARLPDYAVAEALASGGLLAVLDDHQPAPVQLYAASDPDAGLDVMGVLDALAAALA